MTKEEAIEILKDWDGYFVGHSSDDVNEALNIAIKALERQSIDTIKVKETLYRIKSLGLKDEIMTTDDVLDDMKITPYLSLQIRSARSLICFTI